MADMTLAEARQIMAGDCERDPALTLEAVAVWLRFEAIADANLLPIAVSLESVAGELRSPTPEQAAPDADGEEGRDV